MQPVCLSPKILMLYMYICSLVEEKMLLRQLMMNIYGCYKKEIGKLNSQRGGDLLTVIIV
jgi:hypothetical protein